MDLRGKTALVTGGAVRIGRAICLALAGQGVNVIVHYRASEVQASELAVLLERQGVRAWALRADLAAEKKCEGLIRRAMDLACGLDILVNNAAQFHKDTLADADAGTVLEQWQVNLIAPMVLMQAFAELVRRGKIVNLLDRRIAQLDPASASYSLSKKALADCTRLAALTWAPAITVNGIAPGAILAPPGEAPERIRELAGHVPLERQCTPEDVADVVLFLLRNDAVTGQIVFVDGGQHLLALTPDT